MTYGAENERFLAATGISGDFLAKTRVAVELTDAAASVPGGTAAFMLAANILCRIFRDVRLVGPDVPVGPNPWGLRRLSELASPLSALCEGRVEWQNGERVDGVLGIGAPPRTPANVAAFTTFSGWRFGVDTDAPSQQGPMLGALAGACYGASQLFLRIAAASGAHCRPMQPFVFSLLTYATECPGAELPAEILLGTDHLVGVGAVGSAAVYALGHLQGLAGEPVMVDNDGVDDTNLQRYVLMRRADEGHLKVEIAHEVLKRAGLRAVPVHERFDVYHRRELPRIPLLLSPVDSEDCRRRLAGYLPRRALNVATGGSLVTVSRHGFGDGGMCLACLYPPAASDTDWQIVMAKDLGLSIEEVLSRLETNEPVEAQLLRRVERHRGLPPPTLDEFEGKALQTLYRRAVCGSAGVQTPSGTVIAPLAFISALGGVLLASEWLKENVPALAMHRLSNYFRFDLFAAPNPDMLQKRGQRVGCICGDPDYLETYRDRWER